MSHKIELHNSVLEWEIEVSEVGVAASASEIRALDKALRRWKKATDLDTVEFSTTAELVFSYEVKLKDAREVVGVWDFSEDLKDPTVTIASPDRWRLTELIRPDMRNATADAVRELGMSSMVVTFL